MKAMILAAGLGTRMRPLTLTTPKPLIPVNGKPLIEYHLEALAKAGVVDVVINHAWLGEKIEQALGDGKRWGVTITYSREDEPLETGGGVIKALPWLSDDGEPFLLINGDVLIDCDYTQLLSVRPRTAHLVLVDNPEHNKDGDFDLIPNGQVLNPATEKGSALEVDRKRYTFSGVSVINPALFNGVVESKFSLAPLFRAAAQEQLLTGQLHTGFWMDIGTEQRLKDAEHLLRKADAK